MEKDDFKYTLSFGDDVFGGPDLEDAGADADADRYRQQGTVPLLRDADGEPLKRNFVHVEDLVSAHPRGARQSARRAPALQHLHGRPVDYGEVAAYLKKTRGLDSIDIPSDFHSNWMDNTKAKVSSRLATAIRSRTAHRLGFEYQRSPTILGRSGIRVDHGGGREETPAKIGRKGMRKLLMTMAAAALASPSARQCGGEEDLAVVVKGLDNGFFTVMGKGCAKWNEGPQGLRVQCLYTGPALTSDEAGEIQLVSDLIARDDVAGIAISPSNAPAMAKLLTEKAAEIKAKKKAIMTIDADLLPADQALRTTYFGTHNYGMGVKFCEWLKKLQPKGGKVALMFGNPAAENLNERGYGFRDCIKGKVMTAPTTVSRDPLKGEGGWTEVAPTFTNDDIATANQQFAGCARRQPGPHRLRPSRWLGPAGLRGLQCDRQAVRRPLQGRQPGRRRRRYGRLPAGHGPRRLQPTSMSASVPMKWAIARRTL